MAETKGFDLAAVLGDVSKSDTGGVLQMLPAAQIHPNKLNFYDASNVDGLIDAILMDGLQSPLVVNKTAPDNYTIISGHRRFAALSRIIADGLDIAAGKLFSVEISSGRIPCLVNEYASELQAELALIRANSDTRVLTSAETARQIERTQELLYKMKEQGYSFPGKMRDYVAEVCKVSASKIARLKVIREKLIPVFRKSYEKNVLKESVAYLLAQQPTEIQNQVYRYKGGRYLQYWAEWSAKETIQKIQDVTTRPCPKVKGASCSHCEAILGKLFDGSNGYEPCSQWCCTKCEKLGTCKTACPLLADKAKKLREDARAQKRQEADAKAERERPIVERITAYWARFALARQLAGKSVKNWFKHMDMYYGEKSEAEYLQKECGEKIRADTTLPYGYNYFLRDADRLCKAADYLGVSTDYLLCRTDNPKGGAAPAEGWLPLQWLNGMERPVAGQIAVAKFKIDGVCKPLRKIAEWDGSQWRFPVHGTVIDAECVCWFPLPPDQEEDEEE